MQERALNILASEARLHTQSHGVHVAIEATGVKHGGGAHVLLRLVDALLAEPSLGRLTIFASAASDRRFELPADPRCVVVEPQHIERPVTRVFWLEAGLAQRCGELKPDLVFCFNGVGYTGEVPHLNMVQQPLLFEPQVVRMMPPAFRLKINVLRRLTRASCQRAQRVFVQTPTVAAKLSAAFDLSLEQISVHTPDIQWRHAPRISEKSARMREVAAGERLLYVGSDIAYKRVDLLAHAVGILRRDHPKLTLFASIPATHPLARHPGVVALGTLDPGEVRVAMELATMLVMPSQAETVGLPMLEALSVGCPVLASDLAYAHDVCGSAAWFFKAGDPRACANAIRALLHDPISRHELAGKGRIRSAALRRQEPYARMARQILASVEARCAP